MGGRGSPQIQPHAYSSCLEVTACINTMQLFSCAVGVNWGNPTNFGSMLLRTRRIRTRVLLWSQYTNVVGSQCFTPQKAIMCNLIRSIAALSLRESHMRKGVTTQPAIFHGTHQMPFNDTLHRFLRSLSLAETRTPHCYVNRDEVN